MQSKPQSILAVAGGVAARRSDQVAVEEPLEIRIETRSVSVTMRTPGHDDELAAGFLVTEGLLRRRRDVAEIKSYLRNKSANVVDVFLSPDVAIDFQRLTRHVFASSSCGLCGKASIDLVHRHFKPVKPGGRVNAETLVPLAETLASHQETFSRTGGLHAAAIFTFGGEMVVLREDIGRHNAVDKVVGYGFLKGLLPWKGHLLLVSGRASFEIVQKALAARIPLVAAVSAPSSLAVEFAEASGQTLVGFLRAGRMNIYSHPGRIRTARRSRVTGKAVQARWRSAASSR